MKNNTDTNTEQTTMLETLSALVMETAKNFVPLDLSRFSVDQHPILQQALASMKKNPQNSYWRVEDAMFKGDDAQDENFIWECKEITVNSDFDKAFLEFLKNTFPRANITGHPSLVKPLILVSHPQKTEYLISESLLQQLTIDALISELYSSNYQSLKFESETKKTKAYSESIKKRFPSIIISYQTSNLKNDSTPPSHQKPKTLFDKKPADNASKKYKKNPPKSKLIDLPPINAGTYWAPVTCASQRPLQKDTLDMSLADGSKEINTRIIELLFKNDRYKKIKLPAHYKNDPSQKDTIEIIKNLEVSIDFIGNRKNSTTEKTQPPSDKTVKIQAIKNELPPCVPSFSTKSPEPINQEDDTWDDEERDNEKSRNEIATPALQPLEKENNIVRPIPIRRPSLGIFSPPQTSLTEKKEDSKKETIPNLSPNKNSK